MFGLMGVARMSGQPGGAWSPLRLFAASEQGAWYDPSDFASMFQDSAGTTPVTAVEQPVGLILDKRLGLARGAETNPEPYSGSASGTWEISADKVTRNGSTGGQASLTLNAAFADRVVKLAFTVTGFSGDSFYVRVGGGTIIGPIGANGDYVCYPLAGAAPALAIAPWVGSTGEATISNISVREIPGNHATQATAAARPVVSARVNLLTYSEDLSNAAWVKLAGATITGTNLLNMPSEVDSAYNLCVFKPNTPAKVQLRLSGSGTVSLNLFDAGFSSQIQVTLTSTPTVYTHGMTSHPLCTHMFIQIIRAVGDTATSVTVTDVQMEVGTAATRYQRVTTASDYDTVGFPHYLVFDGVDDELETTFPDLGTDVTIARALPLVGASIQTGHTISAGTWLDSTNHAGLVIIDRALTAGETAALTAYLDAKAGV